MKHLRIKVFGKVQGVWYRKFTLETALKNGITGVVMNESDGSVYIEAEGDETALDAFVSYCRKGPVNAVVKRIVMEEGEVKHYHDFQIIH